MTKNNFESKKAGVFLVAGILLLASGCGKHPAPPKDEILTDKERELADWFLKAEEGVPRKLTNDIVGFTRMIECNLDNRDPNPTNWTANVTAEYINHVGGIDRTNLPYKFYFWTQKNYRNGKWVVETNIMAMIDFGKKFKNDMKAIEEGK